MPSNSLFLSALLISAACVPSVLADGNDWVSPVYVDAVASGRAPGKDSEAAKRIIKAGVFSAAKGPWSVTNSRIAPPSNDKRDYLSWAPYWWPECNWCAANGADSAGGASDPDDYEGGNDDDNALPPPLFSAANNVKSSAAPYLSQVPSASAMPSSSLFTGPPPGWPTAGSGVRAWTPTTNTNVVAYVSAATGGGASAAVASATVVYTIGDVTMTTLIRIPPTPTPTVANVPSLRLSSSAGSGGSRSSGGQASFYTGAEVAGAKAANTETCTPSRTSVAPSATWTTCNYVQRDGRVNPDVRWLNNTKDVVSMGQSVLWNGVAYGLSNDASYAKRATDLIYTWFLDPRKGVYPRMTFSQIVRGPKKEAGGYVGILDWRMIVKVVNSILILRSKNAEAWNTVISTAMSNWADDYIEFLTRSPAGKDAVKAPNNHATFYYNQLIAMYILQGNVAAARAAANAYFTGPFMKQFIASGEQPFEAPRTRPFHYRCFNLEGAIVNAKMADSLGLNFWSATSDKGATLQKAVDFMLNLDPGEEDVTELAPLVAAIMAAYGDKAGTYQAFLDEDSNTGDGENVQSWRFYNNNRALVSSPYVGNTKSSQQKGASPPQ